MSQSLFHFHRLHLHRGPARRRWGLAAGALALSAAALAACGSRAASPPVAHAAQPTGSSSSHTSEGQALLLAGRCLRHHGLPNLPDPAIATYGPAKGLPVLAKADLRADPTSVVNQAILACHGPLQQAGVYGMSSTGPTPQQMRDLLAFARCVRAHGIPNFPDPNSQGGFNLAGTGIDSHNLTPSQRAVARTCLPSAHGYVSVPAQGTRQ